MFHTRNSLNRMVGLRFLISLGFVALLSLGQTDAALAAAAPSLGSADSFAVLGASTVTNTGPTLIIGDLGLSPGSSITGFPPGIVTGGTIHATDALALQAQIDTTIAYGDLAGQACDTTMAVPTDISGISLIPGVHCYSSSVQISTGGVLTLDAQGDNDAVWVFKIGSSLTTISGASVVIINGGQDCNVFWQVGSSATLGTNTKLLGTIIAAHDITMNTGATVSGRVLARGVSADGGVTLDSNSVSVCSLSQPPTAPTLGKAFSPATIDEGGVSTLTITLSNADATVAGLTAPLTDTLPSGVLIASIPNTDCGGTVTADTSTVTLTGGSIPANGSCTVTVNVTAAGGGSYFNSLAAGALQTSNGNNAAPAVATLTVPQPPTAPTLGKAFSPATIDEDGVSTLTITLSNADATVASLTAPLIDTLPIGVVIAGPTPNAGTTCGGTVTTGASMVTLTGGSIPANGSCTVTVDVTAPGGGSYFNSLASGALQTSNGNNAAPAVATLTVNTHAGVAPTLGKAFSPASINAGEVSILTITLSNTDDTAASLTAPLLDTLPSGLVIADPGPNAGTTCGGTVTVGPSTVTLTGGLIPANGSCTVTVDVTAPSGGNYLNSLAAGALKTSNGNNAAPAVATLTVSPPSAVTLGKAFSPATINAGGVSTLSITLSNTNATAASLTAPLLDTLPSGVVVADTGLNADNTCGGTLTADTGDSKVILTGGSIPANGSCTVTVGVTAPGGGSYFNSLATGALQTNKGSNATPAVATLTVNQLVILAPTLGKSFSPAGIKAGEASTLTITLSNTNATAASLTAPLIDTLPSGLVVSNTGPNAGTTCGGTLTATTGDSKVILTGGSIPANGSCLVTVDVTAELKGNYHNRLPVGSLKTDKGRNTAPAVATLTVKHPANVSPTLGKAFSPTSIKAGEVSTLTITLSNTNTTAAGLTAPLIDTLPGGLVVSNTDPNAGTTCGGTLTANAGDSKVILTGGSIPANGSCLVTVDVTAELKGRYHNRLPVGSLKTDKGRNTAPAVATLTVKRPANVSPTLRKVFIPAGIDTGGVSTLSITLTNRNSTVAILTAPLTDYLPSGVVVAGTGPNPSNTCGGTFNPITGDTEVSLTGGTIPANGSCTVTVDVTTRDVGRHHNKLPAGALQTDKGSNAAPAFATLIVKRAVRPSLSKSFRRATITEGGVSTLTITLTNPSSTIADQDEPLTDRLPSGVVVADTGRNAGNTCGGTFTPNAGDTEVILTGGSIPAKSSCAVTVDVTASSKGSYQNKLPAHALKTSNGSNTAPALATLTVKAKHTANGH